MTASLLPGWPDTLRFDDAARVRVLYADTDQMGVVYHGTYLRYLEHGRVEFLRRRGTPYAVMESEGLALPVLEQATRYVSPALYDDEVVVRVALVRLSPVRVDFAYRVEVPADGRRGLEAATLLLLGETRHACFDLARKRPTRLPDMVFRTLHSCFVGG